MAYTNISNPKVREHVLNKYQRRCAYCGCDLTMKTLQVDHIEPLRRGMGIACPRGEDDIDNYNPSCGHCNRSKSSMDLEKWRGELSKKQDRLYRDSSTYRLLLRFGMVIERRNSLLFHFEKFM